MTDRELFAGGVNEVERVGATVHRPAGPWTPAVHALLRHVATAGFRGAPRVHGFDPAGREVLDFVAGEVTEDVDATDDAPLEAAARLLRAYHDATVGFVPPPDARWQLPPRDPAEVICHGDVAPYNCVVRDGLPVALIDFDTAHPGPRRWDVAYAAYRFVPLTRPPAGPPPDVQIRRLARFCAAYGLDGTAGIGRLVIARLDALVDFMRRRAAAGDAAFAGHVAAGHDEHYRRDMAHVESMLGPPFQ